ncbi:MAG: glycosyltransferase 87 family protein [Candidatus Methanoplasma sp.]|jgi:hypothetical protein|nr:glycosyltransferase 87 family protein [Candidatus Methanoplasma sp.]
MTECAENHPNKDSCLSFVTRFLKNPIVSILVVGLAVRLALGFVATYGYDVYSWALIIENFESGNGLYGLVGYNYAPPWGYILGVISVFQDLLGVGVVGVRPTDALPIEQYTEWFLTANITSTAFNLTVKIATFVCDIAVGYLVYWIVMHFTGDRKKSTIAFAVWFLCPFVITVGAVGGMFDSFTALMTLMCVIFLIKDRYLLAGMMFGAAALMKFFPAILVFLLVAYILTKHTGRGIAAKNVLTAAAGALAVVAVLLLPQILDGTLASCFSFLTARAGSNIGSGLGSIERYGTMAAYLGILAASFLLARRLRKDPGRDMDMTMLLLVAVNICILLLFPSTPQYIVLLMPFLAILLVMSDRRLRIPLAVLIVGTTMFSLAGNATLLISLATFTDMISMSSVMGAAEWFQAPVLGLSKMGWLYYGGAVLQYVGTAAVFWTLVRGTDFNGASLRLSPGKELG